jgi:hypothetical protein
MPAMGTRLQEITDLPLLSTKLSGSSSSKSSTKAMPQTYQTDDHRHISPQSSLARSLLAHLQVNNQANIPLSATRSKALRRSRSIGARPVEEKSAAYARQVLELRLRPRDKVYASLPLILPPSHPGFAPDHSLCVDQMFVQVVKDFIKYEGTLSILAFRSGSEPDMPSWVRD